MARRVWVTGPQGDFELIESSAGDDVLRDVLVRKPQLIPAEDLGLDGELLVVGRAAPLPSGSADLICLARTGDLVLVQFATGTGVGPFRDALGALLQHGASLWSLDSARGFDQMVVWPYLAGPAVDPRLSDCVDLRDAAELSGWCLDEHSWTALLGRLDQVLSTGDFRFVVVGTAFDQEMVAATAYLNATAHTGQHYLVALTRLDGPAAQVGYATEVVARPGRTTIPIQPAPTAAPPAATPPAAAPWVPEQAAPSLLDGIEDAGYRNAVGELLTGAADLDLQLRWHDAGVSIMMPTADGAVLTIGWVLVDDTDAFGARHVTLGADDQALRETPTVVPAVHRYRQRLMALPGARPAGGGLGAYTFLPCEFPMVEGDVLGIMQLLVEEAAVTRQITGRTRTRA